MLAVHLAGEGCALALADIDQPGLEQTKDKLGASTRATMHLVDVAQRQQVYQFAADVVQEHGQVDVLINNAGVIVSETLEDVSYEDFEWVMGVDFWGMVYGVKAFLPHLKQRPEAHIVNIASVNGILTFPNNGPYCIAKSAIRAFTETLSQELHDTHVKVSCILPGGVRTNLARNARFYKAANPQASREDMLKVFDELAGTSADQAARAIVSGIKKNKRRVLIGRDAWVMDVFKRLLPTWSTIYTGKRVRKL
jgi:NADP-dependent 3-hydroxy acid dehydrogenase YdfG